MAFKVIFEAHPKRTVAVGALLLACAGMIAGLNLGSTFRTNGFSGNLPLFGCGLTVVLVILLLRRGLAALVQVPQLPPLEIPIGVPQDHALLTARLLALETQLEHAPIALFLIDPSRKPNAAESLNANARRLLAPGRATDIDDLFSKLSALTTGQKSLIEFDTERGTERALATATSLTMDGKPQHLIALMPVENELEAEAMQAWQKLVHVLTHEIMNSLTPVASLSHTSRELLNELRANSPSDFSSTVANDIVNDIDLALDAISRRADSLTHFVSGYRTFASLPPAQPQRVPVAELFARLSAMIAPAWEARGGRAVFLLEPDSFELMIDPGQFEQAMINLLKNAAEASEDLAEPEVTVSAKLTRGGRLRVEVRDNGAGVPDEVIAHIFTPFFSTKNKGSGIGLAMVRQLVHRNGGTVRYVKSVGAGACFVITF